MGIYSFAENALTYLLGDSKWVMVTLKLVIIGMILWGSVQAVTLVFSLADLFMGLATIINLLAITLLSRHVVKLTRDYFSQRNRGEEPRFVLGHFSELKGKSTLMSGARRLTAVNSQALVLIQISWC